MRQLCGESAALSLKENTPDWRTRRLIAVVAAVACLLATALITSQNAQHAAQAQQIADVMEAERVIFSQFKTKSTQRHMTAFDTSAVQAPEGIGIVPVHAPSFGVADITAAALIAQERQCLTEALYYEAAFEPAIGQMAVADVVLNRVESIFYPDSICEVVYQGAHRDTGCQFSFTCDGALSRPRNDAVYAALDVKAGAIMAGFRMPVSLNATHYHADYVNPYWAHSLVQTTAIGMHKFYRPATGRSTMTASIAGR